MVCLNSDELMSPNSIASICLLILIGVLILPISGLFIFHLVLISKGRTTNEHVTGKYKGMVFFSRGCFKNFLYLFYGSLIPQYGQVKIRHKKAASGNSELNKKNKRSNYNDTDDENNNKRDNNNCDNQSLGEEDNVCDLKADDDENNQKRHKMKEESNTNDQELLDIILRNKKNVQKVSTGSDTSVCSSNENIS